MLKLSAMLPSPQQDKTQHHRAQKHACVCGARVTFEITYPVVVTLLILVLWLCTGVEDLGLVEFGIGVG